MPILRLCAVAGAATLTVTLPFIDFIVFCDGAWEVAEVLSVALDDLDAAFLVLGIYMMTACKIGEQFRQDAIIWIDDDAVPELLLLR